LAGDVSSQFISALMMVGPYLDGGLEIVLDSAVVSRPYVEMTASVMEHFGAEVSVSSDRIIVVEGRYRARDLEIEADASSASYPAALAALRGGRMVLQGVGSTSLQGDRCFADVLAAMGCGVVWSEQSVTIERHGSAELRAVDIDLRDASDLVPSVAVVAAAALGTTRITGVGFIRNKESDRIGDLVTELRRIGVAAAELSDGLEITGAEALRSHEMVLTHHDHRLAMAFAVLSSARDLSLSIADPGVVTKSWPGFWSELAQWCSLRSADRSDQAADDSASDGR
jgi:3-phosphoshikimate 1-carboxyvinyltransferase